MDIHRVFLLNRDLPHGVRHIPHRLRRGVAKQIEAQRPAGLLGFFRACPYRSELLTDVHEKSPAQCAELQFACGERGIHPFVAPCCILAQKDLTDSRAGDFARLDITSSLSQNHLFQCYLLIPVHLLWVKNAPEYQYL